MKIYTRTGDKGHTSLFSGTRLPKHDIRIEAYGTTDELNSFLGLLRSRVDFPNELVDFIVRIQDRIFTLGSHLANDGARKEVKLPVIHERDIEVLEEEMDRMDEALEPMTHFVLPGGNELVGTCHVCRTVCRRAERRVVALSEHEPIDEMHIRYLNRLSDYLFVLSRFLAKNSGAQESKWHPEY